MLIPIANPSIPLNLINQQVQSRTGQSLSDLQRLVLQECWRSNKKTYDEIASEHNYSSGYIQQRVAPSLWRLLSKTFGTKITKATCKTVLLSQLAIAEPTTAGNTSAGNTSDSSSTVSTTAVPTVLDLPNGSVPPRSQFYIERPQEPHCYQTLLQPGALVRIKGPQQIGKTSLVNRMVAAVADYLVVVLSFQQAEQAVLSDLPRFLRWVCANITQQLGLTPALDDFWADDLGSKMSCTLYLEGYILAELSQPFVLVLEDTSDLFEYPQVARDFFAMIRTWHEYAKTDESWKQLRLILVQSTESYIDLPINQSPFNVGLEVTLPPFTPSQVTQLARIYDLDLHNSAIHALTTLVAGHPYLVRLTLHQLSQGTERWEDLLATAGTDAGIFGAHLHRHLRNLQRYGELGTAFRQVLDRDEPTVLPQEQAFKLHSLGLVRLHQNQTQISCELYQNYFRQRLQVS